MGKYTKGPWRVTDNNALEVESEGDDICRLYQSEEDRANAQLISASPDLLEACKAIVKAENLKRGPTSEARLKAWTLLQYAIRKAEGK